VTAESSVGTIVVACLAVVVIFAVMVGAAMTWAKHGMLPTEPRRLRPMPGWMRRANERGNRQFGWGDGVDDEDAPDQKQRLPRA
jgi:hypothetical protein